MRDNLTERRRVAIIGMAKNCGKTTTLNALTAAEAAAGGRAGLVSIGIDGETSDILIGTPKPPVQVTPGELVTSADASLEQSSAKFEWLEDLEIATPLGRTVVARCLEPGEVVLGGLRHLRDVRLATCRMEELGADRVYIDGAYGRMTSASPELSDSVILSTGAVVSDDLETLVERVATTLRRLQLERCTEPATREMFERAKDDGRALVSTEGGDVPLSSKSALLGLRRHEREWPDDPLVAIPGLVSDGVIDELLAVGAGRLVVADPTAIQCDEQRFGRLMERWEVRVADRVSVDGLAINPTSLRGGTIDAFEFARRVSRYDPNLTVFDPRVGLHSLQTHPYLEK